MAEQLPSYEEAMCRDPWKIITPHLPPNELRAVSLACKSIAEYSIELLWPEPAQYFGEDDEEIIRRYHRTFVGGTLSLPRYRIIPFVFDSSTIGTSQHSKENPHFGPHQDQTKYGRRDRVTHGLAGVHHR